jgi:ABC-type polysaccharide/polyol phosphate transport system ATPase subunit
MCGTEDSCSAGPNQRVGMESELAVEARGLGKCYQVGTGASYGTLRESLARLARPAARERRRAVWALRDVDLAVQRGEILGVIGRNGAGKTTLLRTISRITRPSAGFVRIRGRVGALLEVGTGFHPELTGEENVFLNGAILGLSRREIHERFDEIVAFAGLETFMNAPLKQYSTGMALRLAFSIAAHLEPDIVVVDEVLAVGDAEFQERCLGRMSGLSSEGRTGIFVSHDLGAVARLCSRCVWLDGGKMVADGPTHEVIARYLASGRPEAARVRFEVEPHRQAALRAVAILDSAGRPTTRPRRDEPLRVSLQITVRDQMRDLDAGVYLVNSSGVRVLEDLWSDAQPTGRLRGAGEHGLTIEWPPVLAPGEYTLHAYVARDFELIDEREVLRFTLVPRPDDTSEWVERARVVIAGPRWTAEEGHAGGS